VENQTKICQNCKKDFTIESNDFAFYKKLNVPPPTWCPECRFVRRMTFINERYLYKRVCANCDASIISMYHQDTPIIVWCVRCHISDTWDARDYGRDYDFSRNFFEQFKELKYSIPHRTLDQNERNGAGCEYANYCYTSKNIYLSFDIIGCENIKYSSNVLKHNKNCLDSMLIKANERGYELVQSSQNYNSSFLVESNQCIDSHFLYDCSNCSNCCLSSNLRNKNYVFKNKQLSKEEYQSVFDSLKLNTYFGQTKTKEEFDKIAEKSIHKYADIKNSINVVGDFLENSKNLYHCCGIASGSENVKYAFLGGGVAKDSQDLLFTGRIEECYEFALGGRGGSRNIFSFSCAGGCHNLSYCDNCRGSSDCFGCVGLNKKQYCILNKQYEKEDYLELVEKINKHMNEVPYIDKIGRRYFFGENLPTELSPFAYNESTVFEERPLTKEQTISLGYRWKEMESKSYIPTLKANKLPDSIHDVHDTICGEVVECPNQGKIDTQCTSAFKILPDELTFYRQMNLPIPRYCPNCRYYNRLKWKNPFRFYKRICMCDVSDHGHGDKCDNEFETMHAPDKPEKIYCKECYQREVY